MKAISAVQTRLKDQLNELKDETSDLSSRKSDLANKKDSLIEEQKGLAGQNEVLEVEQGKQEILLNETRENQAGYQATLNKISAEEKALREEIFHIENSLRRRLDPSELPDGILIWPNSGGLVTQKYGCLKTLFARLSYPGCGNRSGGFHNGVDIAAHLGAEIVAVDDGVVVGSSTSRYGYGNWIAVRHSNGLVSVYAHLSKILKKNDSFVKRGERIGNMGSTGFSTGNHTHFILYAPNTFKTVNSSRAGRIPVGATIDPYLYFI